MIDPISRNGKGGADDPIRTDDLPRAAPATSVSQAAALRTSSGWQYSGERSCNAQRPVELNPGDAWVTQLHLESSEFAGLHHLSPPVYGADP